jgi:hypothetical protein
VNGLRPNEQMSLPGLGIPVDPHTGERLTQITILRLGKLNAAAKEFRALLHELDGTSLGSRPGDRRMALAFTKLEEAQMWASAAVLDHHGG